MTTREIIEKAVAQKTAMAVCDGETKIKALLNMANALREDTEVILEANRKDVENARSYISETMIDRLSLDEKRIEGMANGIEDVTKLEDPIGKIISEKTLPNGLILTKTTVPIGVIAIIYESRPNVTSDAAALAVMSGNCVVLRGGKEAINTNLAIAASLKKGLEKASISGDVIGMVEDTERKSSTELMEAIGLIDVLIPRGGKGLIRACVENSKVPCIQTGSGICHAYVDESADTGMALNIIENGKCSRPSVCNALEVLLVNEKIAKEFLPQLKRRLVDEREEKGLKPVELRLCAESAKYISGASAGEDDFDTEFLDYILAVKTVKDVREAVKHISAHSTGHSETIITNNEESAKIFTSCIDSAALYVNASTRFTDGGEFGLGCEIGISTQKLHARGPMGLEELTSYKYIIRGNGQTR